MSFWSKEMGPFTVEGPVVARSHLPLALIRMRSGRICLNCRAEGRLRRSIFKRGGGLQPWWYRYPSLHHVRAGAGARSNLQHDQPL